MRHRLNNVITVILVMGVVGAGLVLTTRTAQADPHAVFYTAIGQKQLFFNVLAALDQADYVEYEYERQDRLKKRAEVETEPPFEEEFELLDVTTVNEEDGNASESSNPGVADLLSRSITLEGNDLYNDQLIRQYGAEFARRNGMSELLRTLCEFGLGITYCDEDLVDVDKLNTIQKSDLAQALCADIADSQANETCINNLKESSFEGVANEDIAKALGFMSINAHIKNPLEWSSLVTASGIIGAAMSNKHVLKDKVLVNIDELERKKRLEEGKDESRFGLVGAPYAYSDLIAAWREQLVIQYKQYNKNGLSDVWEVRYNALENLIENTAIALAGGSKAPDNPYLHLARDTGENYGSIISYPVPVENGSSSVSFVEDENRSLYDFMKLTDDVMMAPARIRQELELAGARVALQQAAVEDEGVFAEARPKAVNPNNPTEIYWDISRPVAVREADIYSLPINLGLLDVSQRVSALKGIDEPGAFPLVVRPEGEEEYTTGGPSGRGPADSAVAGSMSSALKGQVLGDIDLFGWFDTLNGKQKEFMLDYDEERPPTSPAANIVVGHLEQGAVHALRAITGGIFRKKMNGDANEPAESGGMTVP